MVNTQILDMILNNYFNLDMQLLVNHLPNNITTLGKWALPKFGLNCGKTHFRKAPLGGQGVLGFEYTYAAE